MVQQHQKLLSLWVCLFLLAALCTPCADAKLGGFFKGRGKGKSDKPPSSGSSPGLPKKGLKLAGAAAAAAGILGGTGTGLGLLRKAKHHGSGSRSHSSSSYASSSQYHYQQHNEGHANRSQWGGLAKAGAAPAHTLSVFLTVGHVVSFFMATWI